MNPLHRNIQGKSILIIGAPASGKSTFARQLKVLNQEHVILHTDDYIKYGFEQAVDVILEDIKRTNAPTIVEGMNGYRLLRRGYITGKYKPNLVVELLVTSEVQQKIYDTERDPYRYPHMKKFYGAQLKVLDDYRVLVGDNRPEWVRFEFNTLEIHV